MTPRALALLALPLALAFAPGRSHAQDLEPVPPETLPPPVPEPEPAPAPEPTPAPEPVPPPSPLTQAVPPAPLEEGTPAPRGDKRIGPRLGVAIGALSGVAPGGLRAGAVLVWHLDREVWLDVEGAVRYGGGDAACYTGRGDDRPLSCDHGLLDGVALEALAGVRVPLSAWPGGLEPYVRGGVGLSLITFPGDDIAGVSLPLWGGVGGRFMVSPGVGIVAEGTLTIGPAWFDELGMDPVASLIIQGGVELDL